MARDGQAVDIATRTRRTDTITCAPIFKSFDRIVPHVASASSVPGRGKRSISLSAHGRRCEPQPELVGAHGRRRHTVRQQVELAPLMRFSISPRWQ
jgi:hypothetical protein